MDKIILKNMKFYGYHGLFSEEKSLGQRFNVDAELYTCLKRAGETDDMNDSIHYGHVYEAVQKVVEGETLNLIEAVVEKIAAELLAGFPTLQACRIRLTKPDAPIPGHLDSVAVEIYREKTL